MTARIMTIVDVYDALTHDRPYRTAMSHGEAFAAMCQDAVKGVLDGKLVEEFGRLMAARD